MGEGTDKGNCCPQSTAGETSTQQKPEQALIYNLSHINFSWLKALVNLGRSSVGVCMHAHAHKHSNVLAAAHTMCHRSIFAGLQNYPGEVFNPVFPFLFSKTATHLETT